MRCANVSSLTRTCWCQPNRRSIKRVSCPYCCTVQSAGPSYAIKSKARIFSPQVPKSHPRYIQQPAVRTTHYFTRDQAALGRHCYTVTQKVAAHQLEWLGHLARMPEHHLLGSGVGEWHDILYVYYLKIKCVGYKTTKSY